MPTEILITIANLALDMFTITSMLAVGMSLTVKQITDPLRNVRLMILILVGSFVLVPLFTLLLTSVIPMGDDQKTALILLGVCAGGPFIPLLVQTAKGNMPLAAGDMVLLLVITIFIAPLILPLMLSYVQIDPLMIARDLILFMLLPLIIGLLVRWRYAELASRWQPHLSRFSMFSLFFLIGAGLPPALPKIIGTIGTFLIPAAAILALGGWLIGYLLSVGREARQRKVLSLGTGQRNLAAALLVAAHNFSGDAFVMTLVACLVLTLTMFLVAAEWMHRSSDTVAVDS
jgi:BASS family bile acid:Na+ symporter